MFGEVVLKPKKARPIASGHPWIFSGAIQNQTIPPGVDLVRVKNAEGNVLGFGLYSEQSQIRVRMLRGHDSEDFTTDELVARLRGALARRAAVGLPSPNTNTFRWVNSEGDGLPGLVVDRIGAVAVFQALTAPMFLRRELIVEALQTVEEIPVFEVPAPEAIAKKEGFPQVEPRFWTAPPSAEWTIREHGICFGIDATKFQKTGHYADMRLHRQWIRGKSAGKRVLDVYSYTGGFGIYAAVGGAKSVLCVDSSRSALDRALANAQLNGVEDIVKAKKGKAEDVLRSLDDRDERFDVIILDPPKLAPSRHKVDAALNVYQRLILGATRVVEPNGLIAIGSCSQAIGLRELERACARVTERNGVALDVIYVGGQSPDHPYPAAMTEAQYLTMVVVSASNLRL